MKIQQSLVLLVLLVCTGMSVAEPKMPSGLLPDWAYEIEKDPGAFVVKTINKIENTYTGLLWTIGIGAAMAAIFIFSLSSLKSELDRQANIIRGMSSNIASLEEALKHGQDIVQRQEETIKILIAKSGTQAPTQTVILQQPAKPISKPTREIIEFNPNSSEDQTWLADQKRKRQQNR